MFEITYIVSTLITHVLVGVNLICRNLIWRIINGVIISYARKKNLFLCYYDFPLWCRLPLLLNSEKTLFSNLFWFEFHRYKGFHEYVKSKGINIGETVGLDVIVNGIVPTGTFPSTSTLAFFKNKLVSFLYMFFLVQDQDCRALQL